MIVTDGVFSMDGSLAKLPDICDLADKHDAIVVVDDSHATGILGATGRGTPEHFGVLNRVDIITSTLGKTLGGAAGGFTVGRADVIEYLRQRSRPYLFSNALPPPIVMAAKKALELVGESSELRERARQCLADACRFGSGRFQRQAGRASDSARNARRRNPGDAHGRQVAGSWYLRDWLQLSRRAAGTGSNSIADVGSAHTRADRASIGRVCRNRP